MFRWILYALFAALIILFAVLFHIGFLAVLVFLALGGLVTSNSEDLVGYNLVDWLKDHILALFGRFQSFTHAKLARLRASAAAIARAVESEEQKIAGIFRRRR